jgi:hypothetical protein
MTTNYLNASDYLNSSDYLDASDYLVYSSSELFHCDFCSKFGHSTFDCNLYMSVGNALHLKALEVRDFDIEMECNGKSITAWIDSLSLRQIKLLSRRINLPDYAISIWERGLTEQNYSLLISRKDYNICIYLFYYFEPNYCKKKIDIRATKFEKDLKDNFICPICIEEIVPSNIEKECVQFNCNHSTCISCFHSYLNNLPEKNNPSCSLCRETIVLVYLQKEESLINLHKKYLLRMHD